MRRSSESYCEKRNFQQLLSISASAYPIYKHDRKIFSSRIICYMYIIMWRSLDTRGNRKSVDFEYSAKQSIGCWADIQGLVWQNIEEPLISYFIKTTMNISKTLTLHTKHLAYDYSMGPYIVTFTPTALTAPGS